MAKLMRHTLTIPVVVMGAVSEDTQIAAAIAKVCCEDGFFYLTGRGIAPQNIA